MSITTALGARRDALREREAGFTLIELLVVVIIIGILAAIAIPVYIGVQNNAKDSAVKSDLVNAKTSLVSLATDTNGVLPSAVTKPGVATVSGVTPNPDLTKYGWSVSTNTSDLVYSTTGTGAAVTWCVLGTSSTGNKFAISSNTQVTGGTSSSTCPTTF